MTPVRFSALKHIARSPAHYRYELARERTETPAMRIGSYVHHRLLGGTGRYVVYEGERRGKAWDGFRATHDGATILTRAEFDLAEGAVRSVQAHTQAMEKLEGVREHRIRWTIGHRECIGTPDVYNYDYDRVVELKVTADASPRRLPWHARSMYWDAQCAWYADAIGLEHPALFIVAVESKPPHVCAVYGLTGSAIEAARARWRALFERLMTCEASDDWPGYCEGILPFDSLDDMTLAIDGEDVEV